MRMRKSLSVTGLAIVAVQEVYDLP